MQAYDVELFVLLVIRYMSGTTLSQEEIELALRYINCLKQAPFQAVRDVIVRYMQETGHTWFKSANELRDKVYEIYKAYAPPDYVQELGGHTYECWNIPTFPLRSREAQVTRRRKYLISMANRSGDKYALRIQKQRRAIRETERKYWLKVASAYFIEQKYTDGVYALSQANEIRALTMKQIKGSYYNAFYANEVEIYFTPQGKVQLVRVRDEVVLYETDDYLSMRAELDRLLYVILQERLSEYAQGYPFLGTIFNSNAFINAIAPQENRQESVVLQTRP